MRNETIWNGGRGEEEIEKGRIFPNILKYIWIFHKVPQIKVSIYDLDRLYILKGTVHSTNDKFLSVFASKNLMQPTILEKLPNTQCRLVFLFSYCN